MIGSEDSLTTYEYSWYYKILPQIYDWSKPIKRRIKKGKKVKEGFVYSSDT
jgi:UDP-N-acetylglucosamine 4,6-dehydratase